MSAAFLQESSAPLQYEGKQGHTTFAGQHVNDQYVDIDSAASTMPTVLQPHSPSSAAAAPESNPTSTRSAHKPAVLSLSLMSLDMDSKLPGEATAPVARATTTTAASAPASVVSPSSRPPAVVPYTTPPSTPEPAAAPSVPMLQLPIHACNDEVTPVKTLYTRLFHEAQQREQRQAQAQRRQRATQQAEERRKCTFRPRGADAFATPPPDTRPHLPKNSSNGQTPPHGQASTAATPAPPPRAASPASTPRAAKMNRSGHSASEEETAACERLYHNAEQSERRARRLQQLREEQEAEFRSVCTFHPAVSPSKEERLRSLSRSHPSPGAESPDKANNSSSGADAATTSEKAAARSWEHFLADQEERQATQSRRLEELKKRAAEQEHAALFTGVPRSKASEHLKRYLEKKKGYKGPIEGWSERFEHYMKVKQAAEAEASTNITTTAKASSASPSRARSRGSAAPRSGSVFHRLFHDSDEREAMRELIRLMREHHEQTALFKANGGEAAAAAASGNSTSRGSPRSTQQARTSPQSRHHVAEETATAVALATGGAGGEKTLDGEAQGDQHGSAQTIFDTLYAEKETLQRRRELQHVRAQNSAEVYAFHPHLSSHSRALAKETTRAKASGQHNETVRERRARVAEEARAAKAAKQAQVQFHLDIFAHRQHERDRRKEEELLHVLLHERSDDVAACRFRPYISHLTEAIASGNKTYTQLIDDPTVINSLLGRPGVPSAMRDIHAAPAHAGRRRRSSQPVNGGERGYSSASGSALRAALTPVQALAAGAEYLSERSHDAVTEGQMQDCFSAPCATHSTASPSSVSAEEEIRAPMPAEVKASDAEKSGEGDVSTVRIAGAASSKYLRQLEEELQDALQDWSQCI